MDAPELISNDNNIRSGFLPDRIIHLHPTRLCNLACLHCYSDSGPLQKTALDLESLKRAFPLLKAEGYNLVSLSGGEPLTYPFLLPLIDSAHAHDLRVTMITNGLFPNQRIKEVAAKLDGIAISFDGTAEIHNHLRGRIDAFDRASNTLAWLADTGYHVAAAISLIRSAIPGLPDLVDHLVQLGATTLQVRPTAFAGRAKNMPEASPYTAADQARLYLVALALQQELVGQVKIQCDLIPAQNLWQQRNAYASLLSTFDLHDQSANIHTPLADLINPLVITETGTLKPITYDFNPCFNVTNLEILSRKTLTHYKQYHLQTLQVLISRALAQLKVNEGFVDWFDFCSRLGEEPRK